jgi:hypothetical protein
MSVIRIAFAGQLRSGKDTCAQYIMDKYGACNIKFADPLYDLMYTIQDHCGFPNVKDRWLLQTIGTDYARNKNPDIWINKFKDTVDYISRSTNLVCSDARFNNEFEMCKKLNFKVIYIERGRDRRMSFEGMNALEPGVEQLTHASELDMLTYSKFDATIDNNSTIEDLYIELDKIVTVLYPDLEP